MCFQKISVGLRFCMALLFGLLTAEIATAKDFPSHPPAAAVARRVKTTDGTGTGLFCRLTEGR